MARVTSPEAALESRKTYGGGSSLKDKFVDLKPDPSTGKTVKTVRLIGLPLEYIEHSPNKKGPEKGKSIKVPFPDADKNKSFMRVCSKNDPQFGACVWCEQEFKTSVKWAWICLERQGKDTPPVAKILNKGITVFEDIFKFERNNKGFNAEDPDGGDLCEALGGAVAHDVKIEADRVPDSEAFGGVKYTIAVHPKRNTLTAEEIEILRASFEPTAEQKGAILAEDPVLAEYPDWYTYGFNLNSIYRYKGIATDDAPERTTAPADLHPVAGAADDEAKPLTNATRGGGRGNTTTTTQTRTTPPPPAAETGEGMFTGDDDGGNDEGDAAPTW
jgi:hypothetical protein